MFDSLCDEQRVANAVELIKEISGQAYWLDEYIALGYGFSRVGMFEESERALEATLPHLPPVEQRTAQIIDRLATAKLHLWKIDEGATLEKLIHGRDWHQVRSDMPDDQRAVFNRLFREKLLTDENSVDGKAIFFLGCGGFGDQVEQYRNIERLLAEGASVVFADPPAPLTHLLASSSLPVVVQQSTAENLSRCDALAFGNMLNWRYRHSRLSAIPGAGYLKPVRKSGLSLPLPQTPAKRKVGIVWRSDNASCRHEPFRSMELATLQPLLQQAGVQFYSLQFGALRDAEEDRLTRSGVIDLSPRIHTFLDMAELMMQLDLVVTIDSAPAHVAGALDVPVWNMLARVADWRWEQPGLKNTALYPSMRLFRQQELGDWGPVVSDVITALGDVEGANRAQ
ncbi:glycosyltransferase family 9 protein [Burkholderia sp. LMG 32019]|uniref:glycosyltransferase family 9 protein n=1 Tax=Burkholderia sp. LMG 32019 TaxID=3158173 RepID=UPI003C2D91AB